jgi:hypothetical protein
MFVLGPLKFCRGVPIFELRPLFDKDAAGASSTHIVFFSVEEK